MLRERIWKILSKDWNQISLEEDRLIREQIHYSVEFESTLTDLERSLHSTDDPKLIAMQTMITACDFYKADWCGILLFDRKRQVLGRIDSSLDS